MNISYYIHVSPRLSTEKLSQTSFPLNVFEILLFANSSKKFQLYANFRIIRELSNYLRIWLILVFKIFAHPLIVTCTKIFKHRQYVVRTSLNLVDCNKKFNITSSFLCRSKRKQNRLFNLLLVSLSEYIYVLYIFHSSIFSDKSLAFTSKRNKNKYFKWRKFDHYLY